ncbi:uncharacterized protein LOC121262146 [Juglans microcarpa x Juglans regia]|uniref:uncharacterized protein LOC121262146 n=1 Tax=Juglans microcarpa x Juglans regia TaxID=2249226 RepID=UPI001B7F6798|nr:uncharacterized protein LOC121262146 [Juglans microcarpa x Juglans regia]
MEEEDLTTRWKRLHLSKEENSVFHIKPEERKEGSLRGKLCIIGRVLFGKIVHNEAFGTTMSQLWRLGGWVRFKDLNDQCFRIEFQQVQDKEKVLSIRPWCFDRNLLTLQEVDENVSINAMQFRYEPFWIQCHNLPLAAMTEDIGEQFGSSLGHVIRVDVESDGSARRCLRIRVAVDLHKPLLRGEMVGV